MPSLTPMERFISLIGGEQNLPPKTRQPLPVATSPASEQLTEDKIGELPSVDEVVAEDVLWQRARKHNASLPSSVAQPHFTPALATPPHLPADISIDTRMGETAPLGISFAPFGAVTKLCYKSEIVRQEFRQPLATAFFDANKIYTRNWDLLVKMPCHLLTDHRVHTR